LKKGGRKFWTGPSSVPDGYRGEFLKSVLFAWTGNLRKTYWKISV